MGSTKPLLLNRSRLSWAWLIPLLLLTFWLGASGLYDSPWWGDERNSIQDAFGSWRSEPMRSPLEVWQGVAARNPWHAPGYFLLLNAWGRVVGWSEFGLRAASLLYGLLAMAWTYRLGRDLFSAVVGVYAVAILGTSGLFIHYLYYLRVYALFVLLTPCALWLYFRLVRSKGEPSWMVWAGFLAVTSAMLYIHYLAALPLAALGIYHLLFVKKDARWWKVVGGFVAAGILFLPWAGVILAGIENAIDDETRRSVALSAGGVISEFVYIFSNGIPILLVAALLLALTTRHREVWRVVLLIVFILGTLLVINSGLEILLARRTRYLLGLWPLMSLLVAVGIYRLRWWVGLAALAIWMGIGVVNNSSAAFEALLNISSYDYKFPWHRVAGPYREAVQPGDVLILSVPESEDRLASSIQTMTNFYLDNSGVNPIVIEPPEPDTPQEEIRYQRVMRIVETNDPLRVWLGYSTTAEDARKVRAFLEDEDYDTCPTGVNLPAAQFELYTRSQVCCVPNAPPLIRFGSGIGLTGVEPFPDEVRDVLPVLVGWSVADDVPPYTYSVAFHIDDDEGNLVAQSDYGLPQQDFSCQETQIALDHLPPGEYPVFVVVYAWESGQRLEGEAAGERGERLLVGTFRIA